MTSAVFEPALSATMRLQTYTLDRNVTGKQRGLDEHILQTLSFVFSQYLEHFLVGLEKQADMS
jgi:hypothetical protein